MAGMQIVVTAGGTREPIDAVRFIGNVSTGLLGSSVALAAALRGHQVTLIHAHGIALPAGWERVSGAVRKVAFATARDLRRALEQEVPLLRHPAAVVMAAAVADYAPAPFAGKIASDAGELVLRLKKVDKIVDKVKTWNRNVVLVKFKLETNRGRDELVEIGRRSARRSAADLMVLNDMAEMTGGRHPALLLWPDTGRIENVEGKDAIAAAVVGAVEAITAQQAAAQTLGQEPEKA